MVCVLLADGFEEIEGLTPVDFLRRAGVKVVTVGVTGSWIKGAHQITVKADALPQEIDFADVEMIVLPGGLDGTRHLEESEWVQNLIDDAMKRQIPIAAICAAPSILGKRGYLKGKQAVCYPGFEDMLIGAEVKESNVICDGTIITGRSVGTARDFSLMLIEKLCGSNMREQIKETICYHE